MRVRKMPAFILWTAARASDVSGSGTFRSADLPIPSSTVSRNLSRAERLGLVWRTTTAWRYVNPARAMYLLGGKPEEAGRSAYVERFFEDPRAWTWHAALAVIRPNNMPITRRCLEEISGVDRRRMWKLERRTSMAKQQQLRPGPKPWLPNLYRPGLRLGSRRTLSKLIPDWHKTAGPRVRVFFPTAKAAEKALSKGAEVAFVQPLRGRTWSLLPIPGHIKDITGRLVQRDRRWWALRPAFELAGRPRWAG